VTSSHPRVPPAPDRVRSVRRHHHARRAVL